MEESGQSDSKHVGFAEPPPELEEHHDALRKKEEQKLEYNPFHKIPPELLYLHKKPAGPKPLPQEPVKPARTAKSNEILGDLRMMAIKDISVQNKQTEVNFSYPEIDLKLLPRAILVNVKYSSLNGFDLSKINTYAWNLSDTRVGLGYEYVGVISRVGSLVQDFSPGDKVFGCTCPTARHGALASSVILTPGRDIVLTVDEELEQKLAAVDAELRLDLDPKFAVKDDDDDDTDENEQELQISNWPALAKLCAFPVQFCRSMQALQHLQPLARVQTQTQTNVLINGADTQLGITLLQVLCSSLYTGDISVVLVIRESSAQYMTELVNRLTKDPTKARRFYLIPFDMKNDDLVLAGEKTPVNYKKPEFFATEVLNALFGAAPANSITRANVNDYKLDLVVDIIGSKRFLQKQGIRYDRIQTLNIPFVAKLSEPLTEVLNAGAKEPFLVKIMKPKAHNSSFVSFCNYALDPPSYSVDRQLPGTQLLGLWSMKWLQGLANSLLSTFNFYEEHGLTVKRQWLEQGLQLMVNGEVKFRAEYMDWRRFRKHIPGLRRDDGKFLFQVEDF
jgi:NADPH:quinone reductase-like Zn-dependent oxidoreductase